EEAGDAGDAMRRTVGERIVEIKQREFHTLGTVLGGRYPRSPILPDAADVARGDCDSRQYAPSSEPGCLAPHLWRADGQSLYDEFGLGFALVVRPEASRRD